MAVVVAVEQHPVAVDVETAIEEAEHMLVGRLHLKCNTLEGQAEDCPVVRILRLVSINLLLFKVIIALVITNEVEEIE